MRREESESVKVVKEEGASIPWGDQHCTVTRMNDIIEIKALRRMPTSLNNIKKISKEQYILLNTGEIKDYQLGENKTDNILSLKRTFGKIRNLINNNFTGGKNELMVTTTYAENMTDSKKLYNDFDKFIKRFRYKYPNCDYISIVEPQERGAWHCHVLLRFNDVDKIYIPNENIAQIWGHGWTTTRRLKNVDNVGAYLSAYLADIEYTGDNPTGSEIVEKTFDDLDGKTVTKKFIKGGRLHLYPSGMNLYRHSKGIIPPEKEKMLYRDAKKIVGTATPNYSTTVEILDDNGKNLNTITYFSYNLKRQKSQGVVKNEVKSSIAGVSDRPANQGEHSQDKAVLRKLYKNIHSVHTGQTCERTDACEFEGVYALFERQGDNEHYNDTNVCEGVKSVSDVVLQRGLHINQSNGQISFA